MVHTNDANFEGSILSSSRQYLTRLIVSLSPRSSLSLSLPPPNFMFAIIAAIKSNQIEADG